MSEILSIILLLIGIITVDSQIPNLVTFSETWWTVTIGVSIIWWSGMIWVKS
jgi:hypothetical protein